MCDLQSVHFYRRAVRALSDASVPFLVGGGYAMAHYTGIERDTKDLDLFVRAHDCERVLSVLRSAGYEAEIVFSHWLAKAHEGGRYVDIIFSSGNGVARVDDMWFDHAIPGQVLGVPVSLCPVEETIWSKSFILERERYDGADVAHLLRCCGAYLDWQRLLDRFAEHWPVLFSHLALFRFAYPADWNVVPAWVLKELLKRWRKEPDEQLPANLCRGTLLSREQYLSDVRDGSSIDGRLRPWGSLTQEEIDQWTAAIEDSKTKADPVPQGSMP
jgi:hypothetical protein